MILSSAEHKGRYFENVGNQTVVGPLFDFYNRKIILWKSIVNCLVAEEIHIDLKPVNDDRIFILNYPLEIRFV